MDAASSLFSFIWYATIALSVASILLLLGLFVRRLIIQALERRRAARREVIQKRVFDYLADPAGTSFPISPHPSEQRLLLSVVSEMLRGVAGEMREHLILLLNNTLDERHMLRALKTAPAPDRAKIAARLYWSNSSNVHAALQEALDDPSPDVVLAAANAIISAQQHLNLLTLVPKLERRGMLGHRGIRDIFRKVSLDNKAVLLALLDDSNPAIVTLAIDAITRTPSPAAIKRLRTLALHHVSTDVRATALRTLGLAGEGNTKDVVLAALTDPAWEVRAQAAIAAGRLRIEEAGGHLAGLVRDTNWWVQLRAAQALVKLGDHGVATLEALKADDELQRLVTFVLTERHAV